MFIDARDVARLFTLYLWSVFFDVEFPFQEKDLGKSSRPRNQVFCVELHLERDNV